MTLRYYLTGEFRAKLKMKMKFSSDSEQEEFLRALSGLLIKLGVEKACVPNSLSVINHHLLYTIIKCK